MSCRCSDWSPSEEQKISELMKLPIHKDTTIKPAREEAIRMMQRLKASKEWYPNDDACGYYTSLSIEKQNIERSQELEHKRRSTKLGRKPKNATASKRKNDNTDILSKPKRRYNKRNT